jgi:uncharacterized protein
MFNTNALRFRQNTTSVGSTSQPVGSSGDVVSPTQETDTPRPQATRAALLAQSKSAAGRVMRNMEKSIRSNIFPSQDELHTKKAQKAALARLDRAQVPYAKKILASINANPQLILPPHITQAQEARKQKGQDESSFCFDADALRRAHNLTQQEEFPSGSTLDTIKGTKTLINHSPEAKNLPPCLSINDRNPGFTDDYASHVECFFARKEFVLDDFTTGTLNHVLVGAAHRADVDAVAAVLAVDPNLVNTVSHSGFTPLMYALATNSKNDAVVGLLLDAGADVNHKTEQGLTPLMCAAMNPAPHAVKMPLDAGADIGNKTNHGETALSCALEHGHPESIKALAQVWAQPATPKHSLRD